MTTTTTTYGTWTSVDHYSVTVEQTIVETLGDYGSEYDIDAIAAEYRDAINDALPDGVTLSGNEFYGPYYADDVTWDRADYPTVEGSPDLMVLVDSIDLWAIIARGGR